MRRASTLLCLMMCAALWQAQAAQAASAPQHKPTLSGTWALDKSRSKLTSGHPVMKGGTLTLTISHNEPELRVVQKTKNQNGEKKVKEFLYYTDGRGEDNLASQLYVSFYNGDENPDWPSPRRIRSKSVWKDDKLRTRYRLSVRIPDGRQTSITVDEEWRLSSDGQTLTHTTSFSPDDDFFRVNIEPSKLRRVFTKIS